MEHKTKKCEKVKQCGINKKQKIKNERLKRRKKQSN